MISGVYISVMKRNFNSLVVLGTVFTLSLSIVFSGFKAAEPPPAMKWIQLFNGKNLNGWEPKIRYHEFKENFGHTFRVQNGNIEVRYDQYSGKFAEQFGHLFFNKPFSHYLIGVEYRFVGEQLKDGPGWAYRNSGIMIHGQQPSTMKKDQDFPNSIEVQLLGGAGNGERSTANLCTPGTQFVKDGKVIKNHCIESNSKTFNGEQWVRVEVLVLGDSLVVHYVNGEEVLRYERPQLDPVGNASEGELLKGGSISLQSESHPIDFRKVELINLENYAKDPEQLKKVVAQLMSEKRVAKQ
jgi:hypothetical protein